jgi:hypothetical protein
MINPISLALGATAIALLGISELVRSVRLNRAAFAIAVAVFAALAVFAIVMLWRVEHWGWQGDMPEGRIPGVHLVKTDFLLDLLPKEPRFQAIGRKLKFPAE